MSGLEVAHYWHGVPMLDSSKAREAFRDIVDLAAAGGGRLVIQRNGRPVAAMVSLGELEHLLERDHAIDLEMIAANPDAAEAPRDEDIPLAELSRDSLIAPAGIDADSEPEGRGSLTDLEIEVGNLVRRHMKTWAVQVARQSCELMIDEFRNRDSLEPASLMETSAAAEQVVETVTTSVVEEFMGAEGGNGDRLEFLSPEEEEVREAAAPG